MKSIEPKLIRADFLVSRDLKSGQETVSGKLTFNYDCRKCGNPNEFTVDSQDFPKEVLCRSCLTAYEPVNMCSTREEIKQYVYFPTIELREIILK
jgi:hypothetical protein